jgi:FtsZ-binding cell division protein ZapB
MTPRPTSLAAGQGDALQVQINNLGERMDAGFREVKEAIQAFESRVRAVEQQHAGCQPLLQSRIDAAWRKIDEHDTDIKALHQMVTELKQTNRILTWLGGILGSALLIWLISQILGLL